MPREKTPKPLPGQPHPKKRAAVSAESSYANFVDPKQRAALIAEAAYFRAEKRGFAPGHEQEDWLAAEAEVDARLLRGSPAS